MKINKGVVFGVFLFLYTSIFAMVVEQPSFNLTEFAKNSAAFGNKAANLVELEKLVNYLNRAGKYFAVPTFFHISNDEVQNFLNSTKMPDNADQTVLHYINQQLELFKQQQPQDKTALTSQAQATLLKIEKIIEQIFNENAFVITDQERATTLNDYLKKAQESKDSLMVRSTGAEDTKELANAGGNKSIPGVKPDIKNVSVAIGQVIASYFSEKSISQRLIAKDPQLFGAPFMPVLLQVMIGKNPVSGVMFSQEAEGNTPGVTQIQATYGHGEGVVNGLVPVDTFYVGMSKIIHPLIRKKEYRMAPSATAFQLERVANQGSMINNPCMDPAIILNLKKAADAAQRYYGYPVDMEFVLQENIIYLVQARPIITKKREPSYLKPEFIEHVGVADKHHVFTILSAGGAVRVIDTQESVIVSTTIRAALFEKFLKTEDKDAIQGVVIGELAPALSHEANVFNGAGKPVAYDNQLRITESWISSKKFPLLIDTQRGLIALFTPSDAFATPDDAIISNAWFVHPITKQTSLFPQFLIKLSKQETLALVPKEFFKEKSVSGLLDMIKNASAENAEKALQSLLARLWNTINIEQSKKKQLVNKHLVAQLKNIFSHALVASHETLQALKIWERSPQNPEDRLQRLYPVVFLEALIRQLPSSDFVNTYSFSSLIKTEQEEAKISKELEVKTPVLKEFVVQYAKAGQYALTPALNQAWQSYLKQLVTIKDIDLQQKFARMMINLTNLKIMPLWLNNSFAKMSTQATDAPAITTALLKEYEDAEPFFKVLQEKKQQLDSINAAMALWEDPAKYQKQRGLLLDVAGYFGSWRSQEFKKVYEVASPLGKAAALAVMNYLVSTFDTAIKTLESSQSYMNPSDKMTNVKMMLYKYLDLLEDWVALPSIASDIAALLDAYTFVDTSNYIKAITDIIFGSSGNIEQLRGSAGFNVAAAALGSKALWSRSIGNAPTLEDMFTLIHQNLLVVLAQLTKKAAITPTNVPPLVGQLLQEAEKITITLEPGKTSSPALIGVNFDGNSLIYYYNLPILHHSTTFQITYDLKAKQIALSVQFVGDPLMRWQLFANAAYVMSFVGDLSLKQNPQVDETRGQVIFTWTIADEKQARLAIAYIQTLAQFVTRAWPSVHGKKSLLEVIAAITDPQNQQVVQDRIIQSMIHSMVQLPSMMLFLDDVIALKNNNPYDPIVHMFYEAMKKVIAKAPQEIQGHVIEAIDKQITYQKAVSFDDLIDILEILLLKTRNKKIVNSSARWFYSLMRNINRDQIERMVVLAQKLFKINDPAYKALGLSVITAILPSLPKQHIFDLALSLANQGLKIPDYEVQRMAFAIFGKMTEHGYGMQQALEVAQRGLSNPNPKIQVDAFSLLDILAKKDVKIPLKQVLAVVEATQDPEAKKYGLILISSLIAKGLSSKIALSLAEKAAANPNNDFKYGAFKIISEALRQQPQFSLEEKKMIEAVLLTLLKNFGMAGNVYYLFDELVRSNKHEDLVIDILLKVAPEEYFVESQIADILSVLKQHGKAKEAEQIKANIKQVRGSTIDYLFYEY